MVGAGNYLSGGEARDWCWFFRIISTLRHSFQHLWWQCLAISPTKFYSSQLSVLWSYYYLLLRILSQYWLYQICRWPCRSISTESTGRGRNLAKRKWSAPTVSSFTSCWSDPRRPILRLRSPWLGPRARRKCLTPAAVGFFPFCVVIYIHFL